MHLLLLHCLHLKRFIRSLKGYAPSCFINWMVTNSGRRIYKCNVLCTLLVTAFGINYISLINSVNRIRTSPRCRPQALPARAAGRPLYLVTLCFLRKCFCRVYIYIYMYIFEMCDSPCPPQASKNL